LSPENKKPAWRQLKRVLESLCFSSL